MLENKEKIESINLNCPIFNFLKPFNNDQFSKMKGIDLQELICYLDEYYLEFRSNLGLDKNDTFGIEIEAEKTNIDKIRDDINIEFYNSNWMVKEDGSLFNGAEANSPILRDIESDWLEVKKACLIFQKRATICDRSGGHIHIGSQAIGKDIKSWLNLIKIWSIYENIIFRFSYNEKLVARACMDKYAEPMALRFKKLYYVLIDKKNLDFSDIIDKIIFFEKYQAICFKNVKFNQKGCKKDTIEFRCPNGTLDPVIWQNNINFFAKLLKYSASNNFNDDIIDKRCAINEDRYYDLKLYGEIYLDQALELADLLFKTNLDKIYFLRQYLKNFEVYRNSGNKAKQFTKK